MVSQTNKARIAIAEDEIIIAADLKSRLEGLGYLVCGVANSGSRILELADRERPDLVLMDIVLKGGMDGVEAAESIRSRFDIPVVFVTAYAEEERLEKAKLTLPFGYVLKPFQDRDLKIVISMALYVARADRQRRDAEAAMKRSEEEKSLILNSAGELIAYYDLDLRLKWANSTAYESIMPEKDKDLAGKRCHEIWYDRDTPCDGCPIVRTIRTGAPQTGEILTKQGRNFLLRGYPARNEQGDMVGVIEFGQDITEQKRAEESLRESEACFRQLFDNMGDGVAIYSAVDDGDDFVFVDINQAAQRLSRISRDEVIGRRLTALFPAVKNAGILDVFQRVWKTGRSENYPLTLYDDGRVRQWVENKVFKIPSGLLIAIYNDTSEQKRIEQDLRESEERLRIIFEYAPDAYYLHDLDGCFLDLNHAAEMLSGYRKEELVGQSILETGLVSENDHPAIRKMLEAASQGRPTGPDEVVLKTRHGGTITADIRTYPVKIKGRAVVLGIARDISVRKKTETELKTALKEKNFLLKEVHHRIKNNMQIVSSLLSLQASREQDMSVLKALNDSRYRIAAMSVAHEFLYRSESPAEINLGRYLAKLAENLAQSFQKADGVPAMHIATAPDIMIGADMAIPCGLIANELITNAFKYAFPEKTGGDIWLELKTDGKDNLSLTVRDNGRGLPPDTDWETTETLGLLLVRNLAVNQLDGDLRLNRAEGTMFTVTFSR